MSSALGTETESLTQQLRSRVPVIRAADAITAALQSAFAASNLMGSDNAFRFNRDDPRGSAVWICAPDNVVKNERDGRRVLITVERGDYSPAELHLQNYAEGGFTSDTATFSDLASTTIYIKCAAGSRIQSEMVASVSYNVLKMFRRDLMREFDIHNIRLVGISAPLELNDAPGNPWLTVVSVRVDVQESALVTELTQQLNRVNFLGAVKDTVMQNLGTTSTEVEFPPVEPLPGFIGTAENG